MGKENFKKRKKISHRFDRNFFPVIIRVGIVDPNENGDRFPRRV